ncbi:hypothetical protein [Paenibacillus odorifer]|uniref:hypothetical protein n=1 Tax=Paenibacillus odorifer TaxID=189426 RepID=UPI00349FBE21
MNFLDSKRELLKKISFNNLPGVTSGAEYALDLKGVVYIEFVNTYSPFTARIYEFDIFGTYSEDPIPTVTPKPTTTPEQPSGDRAILTITLVNGTEKEYDLPIAEVDAFLNWYDARDAGRGTGSYGINKHSNNKGPFSKRKEYVIFDKILTFEVSEYTIQ